MSDIEQLYAVASDAQAAVLDELRLRAGHVWEHRGCWTNPAAAAFCQCCGRARAELHALGESG
jgi:hypothetical protein